MEYQSTALWEARVTQMFGADIWSMRPFLSRIENGFRCEFSLDDFRRPDSPSRRRCCSSISGDECDSAIFVSPSSPMTSRRADEFVVEWITSDTETLTAVFAWLERKTIDRIQRVAR